MKIAAAILFSLALLAGPEGRGSQENPPLVICCAGDSLMRPVPVHLRPLLKTETKRPFQVRDWAQGGQTSETYPAFLRQHWENWKSVRPDFIIIQIGTNDALPILQGKYDPDRFEENLRGIVRTFKGLNGGSGPGPLVLMATAPPFRGTQDFEEKNRIIRSSINPIIRKIAEHEGAALVDNGSILEGRPDLYDPDGVHPSPDGEKAIARNWLRAIKKEWTGTLRSGESEVPFEGRIVFQSDTDGDSEVYILTEKSLLKITDNDWRDEYPRWSPDGRRIAFSSNRTGNFDIYVMNEDGTGVRQVTSGPRDEGELAWFPDGKRIAYTEETRRPLGRSYSLWSVDLGSGQKSRILPDFPGSNALPAFSPPGSLMAFTGKKTMGWDVFVYDPGPNETKNLTGNGKTCRPSFSPDGSRIAYVSHESDGKGDIWLMGSDGGAPARLTVRDDTSDYFPCWSPDGRFVLFCSNATSIYAEQGDWDLYLVDVQTGEVRLLFNSPGRNVFPDWRR